MTSICEIIETIHLEAQSIDSIFRNKPRYLMSLYAKEGMKKMGLTFGLNLTSMNVRVPSSGVVYHPKGYETFVRAYIINSDGKRIELNINNKLPAEIRHYLTLCDGSLLSCGDEEIYDTCIDTNDDKPKEDICGCDPYDEEESCSVCVRNHLLEDIKRYGDSWINTNKKDRFEFSEDLEGVAVCIEYISNQTINADDSAIAVDDKYSEMLEYYIKYRLLQGGQDTMQMAEYYNKKYKGLSYSLSSKDNPLSKNDIFKFFMS
jgi:hypothetical protein